MTNTVAMIFPGQGSQSVGMLSAYVAQYPLVQEYFSRASDVVGYDLWDVVQNGPADKLNQTEITQPALLTADVALYEIWKSLDAPKPAMMAGHSLGEYSALVCANALTFEDAVKLVQKRGEAMQAAVPAGTGAMAAILGLADDKVVELCDAHKNHDVLSAANFNSVGQVVIAGHQAAVQRAVDAAKSFGAKLAKVIPVSVPSHCALMQPAAEALSAVMETVTVLAPTIPVVHNVDVSVHEVPDKIKEALIAQLTQPVRWVDTIQWLQSQGITQCVECGPGKVLTGLNKRIDKTLTTYSTETPEAMTTALNDIGGKATCP